MIGLLNGAVKSIARTLTGELRREAMTTARRVVRERIHDTFHTYNGTDPSKARTEFARALRATKGVLDVRVTTDPENKSRRVLMVSVEDEATQVQVNDYLRDRAPNVNRLVTVL